MKKGILIALLMFGFAATTSATDIKVHTYLVSEISPECVELLVVVTSDIKGSETVYRNGNY